LPYLSSAPAKTNQTGWLIGKTDRLVGFGLHNLRNRITNRKPIGFTSFFLGKIGHWFHWHLPWWEYQKIKVFKTAL
jgi:hypothetical protein